jgi:hypothetical protein
MFLYKGGKTMKDFNNNENCCYHGSLFGRIMKIIGITVGGVIMAGVFALLFGYVIMLLWNWLMPMLFGLKAITYWQGFGLVILAKILFGNFGGHHGRHHRKFHHHGMHKWAGHYSNDEWAPKGSYKNWKYYEQYWHEEGKAAFESYLDKIQKEDKDKDKE